MPVETASPFHMTSRGRPTLRDMIFIMSSGEQDNGGEERGVCDKAQYLLRLCSTGRDFVNGLGHSEPDDRRLILPEFIQRGHGRRRVATHLA